ncbi:MAG TPA: UvrD-helicase domain-containing protein [Candidatus Ruthenibacterium merdigallinarum]|nr:UvrD-helicase domain-containing protein [Candidatus Ruthenibacterium merdigallinarum]
MSVQWTDSQRAAIEDRGGSLLVSAAAGSGKTAVLVERAVQLICDEKAPVAADRLLIVTFTRAAAEELRARIAMRLAEEAARRPDSAWLRRQRLLLGRADIGTIDAFCMQLLRQNFARLDLPADFGLADDALCFSLREEALAQTLEQAYADEDFCAFASLYGRARTDGTAAGALLALYDFLRTLPQPHAALEEFIASYEGTGELGATAWGRALLDEAVHAAQAASSLIDSARRICRADKPLAGYLPALDADAAFFSSLASLASAGRWDDAALAAAGYEPERLRAVRGGDAAAKEMVKSLRQSAKDLAQALKKDVFVCTQAEFLADRARTAPMLRALGRAVRAFEAHFFDAKMEQKVLEYSDFEHLALRLLRDEDGRRTDAAREISARYDAVMVDEYQDTNALQAALYACLAKEDGSNLFFVGDVKQSIYRFRLADPRSFLDKRAAFAPYTPGGAHPMRIDLSHNFRSAQSVIGAVNDVFSCLMSPQVGGVAYTGGERLRAGAPDGYDGGPMELLVQDAAAEDYDGDARAVAGRIAALVREGFPVREKSGGTRPCEWGDFCILVRSRARFSQYEAALARLGIPASADAMDSPLTAGEVTPLLCLLRVIDNPARDVDMAGAMLSPMFHFTPDDLAGLRLAAPDAPLYTAVTSSKAPRVQRFAALLRALRTLAATEPVETLCAEILSRTNYFAAVGAMENGPARRENLRAFTAWAKAAGAQGLPALLRAVDDAVESGAARAAGAPALAKGSVSIMTVHRSKGLEFPIVILADCARRFNLRDAYSPVLFHPQLGVGMTLRAGEGGLYATAPHRAVQLWQRREAVSEEMRILYVALTRARDKLLVSLPLRDVGKTLGRIAVQLAGLGGVTPYFAGEADSFADWLCAAGLVHRDGGLLRALAGAATLPLQRSEGHIEVRLVGASPADGQKEAAAAPQPAQPDEALVRALGEGFAARYEKQALTQLPAKVSVSALVHGAEAPVLARPAFLYRERITAAERGTAMHAALQFANLAHAQADPAAELERLRAGGWLDADLAAKLRAQDFAAFLSSPLCARMLRAQPLLREYAFLTAVPAKFVQPDVGEAFAHRPVLVQGIADAVLVCGDTAEVADYKTDRLSDPAQFLARYRAQLLLYRAAVEKKLGVKVTRCTIYSFSLAAEIDVPL